MRLGIVSKKLTAVHFHHQIFAFAEDLVHWVVAFSIQCLPATLYDLAGVLLAEVMIKALQASIEFSIKFTFFQMRQT